MINCLNDVTAAAICIVLCAVPAWGATKINPPPPVEIERLNLDKDFYKKYVNTCLPVIGSEKVSDAAPKIAISSTSDATARFRPFSFGTRTG